MIKKINISPQDEKFINGTNSIPEITAKNEFDYSRIIVQKPWGYEYPIFQNAHVSVWILYIKKGALTSMHCHPNKKTSLIMLSGEAIVRTLNSKMFTQTGHAIDIGKKVFHSTEAISEPGVVVMETETPNDKYDLLRLEDKYGRAGMQYEGKEHSLPRSPSMHFSFHDERDYHNEEKIFGQCRLSIKRFRTNQEFSECFPKIEADIVFVLKGTFIKPPDICILEPGDTSNFFEIKKHNDLKIAHGESELLLIKKL